MEKDLLYKEITGKIIGAAMEVHRVLGPGFLESVYEEAFCIELDSLGLQYKRQEELRIPYKDCILKQRYRADLIVEERVIVDNKATKGIVEIDQDQLFNYLKATRLKVGLIINFGELRLRWKRIICEKYFR